MVEIVKIDEETGRNDSYKMPVPRNMAYEMEPGFMDAICNVGDFVIVEDKVYRRIRGGWRDATDDDLAELLAAKLGEENLEE